MNGIVLAFAAILALCVIFASASDEAPETVAIDSDVKYTITVLVDPADSGTVTGDGEYDEGATATLNATPNEGYVFKEWSDGNKQNPRSFEVTESKTFTAYFELDAYNVSFEAGTGGDVDPKAIYSVPHGSVIHVSNETVKINDTTVTASADTHYTFDAWSVSDGDVVTGPMTITASFKIDKFTVSFAAGTGGSVSGSSIADVPYGATINVSGNEVTINGETITATASDNYVFDKWTVDGGDVPSTVTGAITISANFKQTFTVSFDVYESTGGTLSGSSIANVPLGSTIAVSGNMVTINGTTITANASEHYSFDCWKCGEGEVPSTVTGAITITAHFKIDTFTVSFATTEGGSLSGTTIDNVPYDSDITVSENTVKINGITITATATYDYYKFDKWTVNGGDVPAKVKDAMTIVANFKIDTYTVTFDVYEGTGGTLTGTSITDVPHGATINVSGNKVTINGTEVTANPDAHYTFDCWKCGEGSVPATVTEAITITAHFKIDTFTITFYIDTEEQKFGSLTESSVANVPYGTKIIVNENVITFDPTMGVTVTANETTAMDFDGHFYVWSVESETIVEDNMEVRAYFYGTCNITIEVDGETFGKVEPTTMDPIVYGTTYLIDATTGVVTFISGKTITPTPYTESFTGKFEGWTIDPSGTGTIEKHTTFTATFTATCKVSVTVTGSLFGYVDPSYVDVPYGAKIASIDADGKLTFDSGETLTPVPYTLYFTGKFESWDVTVGTEVKSNTTFDVTFSAACRVSVSITGETFGYVDPSYVDVPYGTTISTIGADGKITFDSTQTLTPVPYTTLFTGKFEGWNVVAGTEITSNTTFTATFSATCNITITVVGETFGKVDPTTMAPLAYGTTYTTDSNGKITFSSGQTITPTPYTTEFAGKFEGWNVAASGTIEKHTEFKATFSATCKVTVLVTGSTFGYVDPSYVDVPYGAKIASIDADGKLTFDSTQTLTPVPYTTEFEGKFEGWDVSVGKEIKTHATFNATFSATCNITVTVVKDQFGSVDPMTATVKYGSVVSIDDDGVMTFSLDPTVAITPTPTSSTEFTAKFVGWDVTAGTVVTKHSDFKATFTATCDVTIVSNDTRLGTVKPSLIAVTYGSGITIDDNKMTIDGQTVIATPNDPTLVFIFSFKEWDIPGGVTSVTKHITITAVFDYEYVLYEVTFFNGTESYTNYYIYEAHLERTQEIVNLEFDQSGQYAFVGWYTVDDARWDFSFDVVRDDVLLVAKWTELSPEGRIEVRTDALGTAEIRVPTYLTEIVVISNTAADSNSKIVINDRSALLSLEGSILLVNISAIQKSVYDITVQKDGKQFNEKMTIYLQYDKDEGDPSVYWVYAGGEQKMDSVTSPNGLIHFDTDHNSRYEIRYIPTNEPSISVITIMGILFAIVLLGILVVAYRGRRRH